MGDDRVDVLIVGAGMIGATLACALSGHGLRVVLLDKSMPDTEIPEKYDLRVSAIGLGSQRVFERLAVWSDIAGARISPFEHMFVWDAGSAGSIEFDAARIGVPYLGHIIENRIISSALVRRLAHQPDVVLRYPAPVTDITAGPNRIVARLADRDIEADLLVGADGSSSTVRCLLGIPARSDSYAQSAIVAYVETELPHRRTAWQRFLPSGPLAFLPLADGASSIVWSVDQPLAERLLGMSDAEFAAELERAFEQRLGRIVSVGPRQAFPLRRVNAISDVGPRSVLIGDAAHTVHPLAGQGANLGIADAAALAEVLVAAHRRGRDIGGAPVLRHYARWRKSENGLMLDALHGLKSLFGAQAGLIRGLRGVGLTLTDRSGPLKNAIIRRAVGVSGDLPRLVRGHPLNG